MRYAITAESDGERILKIGQHLPKLWARIKVGVFFLNTVYILPVRIGMESLYQQRHQS